MSDIKQQYLKAMGVEVWKQKAPAASTVTAKTAPTVAAKTAPITEAIVAPVAAAVMTNNLVSEISPTAALSWEELEQRARACKLCALHATRTNVVFGVGNRQTEVMLVGEAPGANEDLQGEPFVGRAGMLLNAMLLSIGIERRDVYIANVLKCRPPNNRDPLPSETGACTPYLQQQIALIKPKVLIAVGRVAGQFLLKCDESMGRLRGKISQYRQGDLHIPLFVIYHPAYLLRSPSEKSKAYEDMLRIREFLQKSNSQLMKPVA
jgi:uracil-DNA glycosylase